MTDSKKQSMDVEMAEKMKEPNTERYHHHSLPNRLFLLIILAASCGLLVYMYQMAWRIHALEQRIEVMSLRCGVIDGPRRTMPSSTADLHLDTSDDTTTSVSSQSLTSTFSSSTSSSLPGKDLNAAANRWNDTYDVDDYYNYDEQASSGGLPDDDEDAVEYSGDDGLGVESDWFLRYWALKSSYSGRWKRSVSGVQDSKLPISDDAAADTSRRQHHRGHHGRRRRPAADDTPRNPTRKSRNERRRDRKTSRRRQRAQSGGGAVTRLNQVTGVKAAHFYAPRGPDKLYTSGSVPPATFPFWKAANWTLSQNDWFSLNNDGIVTVLKPGLYMIYAQLVYHDLSGRWSFGVFVSDKERVKCMNTEQINVERPRGSHHRGHGDSHQVPSSHGVYQHCYTSTVLYLSRFDSLSVRCLYGSRSVVMQPEFTFWGLIQLSSTNE